MCYNIVLQRLQATQENTNGDTAPPTPTPQEKPEELPPPPAKEVQQQEVQRENVSLTPIPKQQQPEEGAEPERPEEMSLTPPLLPSMKIKDQAESESVKNQNDGKEKEKNKKSQWDMFAEQDIFKANTDVSFFFVWFCCIIMFCVKGKKIKYKWYNVY